jgi:hypothetical protein
MHSGGSFGAAGFRSAGATVVVPTRNEAGNVAELVARLEALPGGAVAEIVFVDDSDDDTPRSSSGWRPRRRCPSA